MATERVDVLDVAESASSQHHAFRYALRADAGRLLHARLLTKRAIDVVGSVAILLLTAPVLVIVAICIACQSRGGVLFSQTRSGIRGRHFRMFKFRTMTADAEARLEEVRHLNVHSDARFYKGVADPRITRVGKVLRRFSLDELPQLFNVLRGDMSLVGPRPLELHEDEHVRGTDRRRLDMRPGITGLWQVSGRNELSFETMIRLDLDYVSHWRLRQDFVLLAKTVPAMVGRQEAP